jgi:hypothetical protein
MADKKYQLVMINKILKREIIHIQNVLKFNFDVSYYIFVKSLTLNEIENNSNNRRHQAP